MRHASAERLCQAGAAAAAAQRERVDRRGGAGRALRRQAAVALHGAQRGALRRREHLQPRQAQRVDVARLHGDARGRRVRDLEGAMQEHLPEVTGVSGGPLRGGGWGGGSSP